MTKKVLVRMENNLVRKLKNVIEAIFARALVGCGKMWKLRYLRLRGNVASLPLWVSREENPFTGVKGDLFSHEKNSYIVVCRQNLSCIRSCIDCFQPTCRAGDPLCGKCRDRKQKTLSALSRDARQSELDELIALDWRLKRVPEKGQFEQNCFYAALN